MKSGPPSQSELHELTQWLNILRLDSWNDAPDPGMRARFLVKIRQDAAQWKRTRKAAVEAARDRSTKKVPSGAE